MIYLDHGATSMNKPPEVLRAVNAAIRLCGNPGRGGHPQAMRAAETVYDCRQRAGRIFGCQPEQVVFTGSCTHGLNMAIRSLVRPGERVVISGFEHNAVARTLYDLGAQVVVAGRRLFDPEDTVAAFREALTPQTRAAVFTHVSNVFGYILPIKELAALCRSREIPFIIDAAQSAGMLPVNLEELGADFIAMPGHKGLLGPQGTGLLLCGRQPKPLLTGGTGSLSASLEMPDFLPDAGEAGTLNVPGIAGVNAGLRYLEKTGMARLFQRQCAHARLCAVALARRGMRVFTGAEQSGTLSFVPPDDCEELAHYLAGKGIAVRAGLHCAPLAHESAGTLGTGTVRVSFGHDASPAQIEKLMAALERKVYKS